MCNIERRRKTRGRGERKRREEEESFFSKRQKLNARHRRQMEGDTRKRRRRRGEEDGRKRRRRGRWELPFKEQKTITADPGRNVTLSCGAPKNNTIIVVNWSRADQGDQYVLLYRDGHFVPDDQHPFFKNRVDLQDRQMKDGDASLILKNVTTNDTGTYKCRVFTEETRSLKLMESIYLRVSAPPGPGGGAALIAGLSVAALLLVAAVVAFVIYRKHKQQNQNPGNETQ